MIFDKVETQNKIQKSSYITNIQMDRFIIWVEVFKVQCGDSFLEFILIKKIDLKK